MGLGSCIYLWNAETSKVTKLYDLGQSDSITSIGWSPDGVQLAVGTDLGSIQIWDVNKAEMVRTFEGHLS